MVLVESGLTTVLYSSVIVFAGIFSRVLFKKSISSIRWVCIIWIWASVGLSAGGQVTSVAGIDQVIGIVAVLASAVVYGLKFVLVDNIVSKKLTPLEIGVFFWP